MKDDLETLKAIGSDYAVFQSAQYAAKVIKRASKDINRIKQRGDEMTIRGLTKKQLVKVAKSVGLEYGWNNHRLETLTKHGLTCRATLSLNGTKKYQRAGFMRNNDGSRRKIGSVCWHGHRDWMKAIFKINPDAIIISKLARYDGIDDFNSTFPDTYYTDVGSMMKPAYYGELFFCE